MTVARRRRRQNLRRAPISRARRPTVSENTEEAIKKKVDAARARQDQRDPAINEALDFLFGNGLSSYPPALMSPDSCTVEVWKKASPAITNGRGGQFDAEPARLSTRYHLNTLDPARAALDIEAPMGHMKVGSYVLSVPGSSVAEEEFDEKGRVQKSKDLKLYVGLVGTTPTSDVQRSKAALLYLYKSGVCKGKARAF